MLWPVCLAALAASPLSLQEDRYAVMLVSELDYRVQSAEVEGLNGFSLARFRIGARAQPTPWFRLVGTVEWAGEKPALNDAFFELRPLDDWRVTVGYSKTPLFVTGKDQQVEALAIPERSMVVRSFWPRRDLGVEVSWRPSQLPLEAWLRVGNGSGSPLGNDNTQPAGEARVDLTGGRERRGERGSAWGARWGVGAHLEDAFDRAGIGGTTPQGFLFYRPPPISGPRAVTESHLVLSYGPARLLVEAAAGWESRSRDTDGDPSTPRESLPSLLSRGASVELSWVLRGLPRVSPTWPEAARSPGVEGWTGGSVELAGRLERLWLGVRAPDVAPGGALGGAAALRWWTNEFLGVGLAAYWLKYDTAPLEEPDRTVSWLALSRVTVKFR